MFHGKINCVQEYWVKGMAELEEEVEDTLEMLQKDFGGDWRVSFDRPVEMHYAGNGYEVTVRFERGNGL